VPAAPAASCAKGSKAHELVTTDPPEHPAFPHAMVLTVSFALSPVTGLSCHRRLADNSAKLDASVGASGPHDFSVRKLAHSSARRLRPPHPAPYVRDDRETPLCVGRDGGICKSDLGQARKEIFLQRGLDSRMAKEPVGQITGLIVRSDHRLPLVFLVLNEWPALPQKARCCSANFPGHKSYRPRVAPVDMTQGLRPQVLAQNSRSPIPRCVLADCISSRRSHQISKFESLPLI
jgi:hypothetical protein